MAGGRREGCALVIKFSSAGNQTSSHQSMLIATFMRHIKSLAFRSLKTHSHSATRDTLPIGPTQDDCTPYDNCQFQFVHGMSTRHLQSAFRSARAREYRWPPLYR